MKNIILPSFSILLAVSSQAATFRFNKQVTPETLAKEFSAAGIAVKDFYSDGKKLVVVTADGEKKDPSAVVAAHVRVDSRALFKKRDDELHALVKKHREGGLSAAEKDDLLLRLAERVLGSDQL